MAQGHGLLRFMTAVWSRRWRALASLALVAALGCMLGAEAFDHTDDGCVVETHCLACRWHYGGTVVPTVLALPAAPTDLGQVGRSVKLAYTLRF
jgi:hypothetical protein